MVAVDDTDLLRTLWASDGSLASGKNGGEELPRFLQILVVTPDTRVIDGLNGTHGFASATFGALVRLNPQATFGLIDAIDRTDIDASLVLAVDAAVRDHVGHLSFFIGAVAR